MDLGTDINLEIPSLAYVDYTAVPDVRAAAHDLKLESANDAPEVAGYVFRAYVEENLLTEDPEALPNFDDLRFDEVAVGALDGTLGEAREALLDSLSSALGEDAAATFEHRLNGSVEGFAAALIA